jgi:hypothetical protein
MQEPDEHLALAVRELLHGAITGLLMRRTALFEAMVFLSR